VQGGLVARRSVQVAHVLLVVAAAYAGALAISAGIGLWLDDEAPVKSTPSLSPAPAAAPRANRKQSDLSIIFKRNLFGSEPLAVSGAESPGTSNMGNLRLVGTAEVDSQGYAVFEDSSSRGQDVFAVGERVFDGPKLVSVGQDRAVLLYQGRKRTISLTETEPQATSNETNDASGGIRKTGNKSYLLDRREVEHTLENLNTVITQMRAVPYLRDGKSLGFRVFNIRPGSIFDRMGLHNGDVVQRINGSDLNSPANAMGLLDTVADASEIRVDLLRGEKLESLTYRIQ